MLVQQLLGGLRAAAASGTDPEAMLQFAQRTSALV
jgi:hypothetical protein